MAERRPALLTAYRALSNALRPAFHLVHWQRGRSGKEIIARKGERFGRTSCPRPSGILIWIHAASVGETTSVLPLIEKLAMDGNRILLTTVTVTSSEIAEKRLPEGCIHQFATYDCARYVNRFLDHWKPDLAMVVESEIWPCMFSEVCGRKIPFVMLNGRLSATSARNWSILSKTSSYIFNCLDLVLAQSRTDAVRLQSLGCQRVETPGNLKFDASEPTADQSVVEKTVGQIADRPVWLAALTHPGEEDIVLQAHRELAGEFPNLLLVLVPRHPARADDVAELVQQSGFNLARRSCNDQIAADVDVFLGDTLGEMGLFYRLAPVAFLGGSFNEAGGHNPVEAALLGSALVTGPKVANARAIYKGLWEQNAAASVERSEDLSKHIADLLRNPKEAQMQADRAADLVRAGRGAVDRTLELIAPFLNGSAKSGYPGGGNEDRS